MGSQAVGDAWTDAEGNGSGSGGSCVDDPRDGMRRRWHVRRAMLMLCEIF